MGQMDNNTIELTTKGQGWMHKDIKRLKATIIGSNTTGIVALSFT